MIKQIVFLALAISCVSANLSFTDCGSGAVIHALRIGGCAAVPCTFRRGDTYVIEMDVTATSSSNALPFQIQGLVPPLPPITVLSGNACTTLIQGSCPKVAGHFFVSRINYTVGDMLPMIPLTVRFTVNDDFQQAVVCGEIPVQVTAP